MESGSRARDREWGAWYIVYEEAHGIVQRLEGQRKELIILPLITIECIHMTSRRPCWMSKQRNGGHVGGVKFSFGDWILFLCKFLLLFHYTNMASCHMSEHTLHQVFVSHFTIDAAPVSFETKPTAPPLEGQISSMTFHSQATLNTEFETALDCFQSGAAF